MEDIAKRYKVPLFYIWELGGGCPDRQELDRWKSGRGLFGAVESGGTYWTRFYC